MRQLVDLLNNDTGYVRIFADHTGFGYERATYRPCDIGDLFDRMNGYPSIAIAREAARLQLQAPLGRRRTRRSRRSARV
ncbi:MAG TPA: hypothetical protein VIL28_16985 [Steroidobacteraceae bacterium]